MDSDFVDVPEHVVFGGCGGRKLYYIPSGSADGILFSGMGVLEKT